MLKLGILGAGHIAEKLAGVYNFLRNDIEPYAVASRTIEKAQAIAEKFNFTKAYGSYGELLSDPDVDVVYVATPHSHHYEHMLMCIEHGKHILCEKAFTVNERQAQIIFEKAKEIIESGTIGELYFVESEYAHDYMKLCDNWRADPNRHGVIGGGCHAVDLLRWLAGDPKEVFAYGTHKLLPMVPYNDATIAIRNFRCYNKIRGEKYESRTNFSRFRNPCH